MLDRSIVEFIAERFRVGVELNDEVKHRIVVFGDKKDIDRARSFIKRLKPIILHELYDNWMSDRVSDGGRDEKRCEIRSWQDDLNSEVLRLGLLDWDSLARPRKGEQ